MEHVPFRGPGDIVIALRQNAVAFYTDQPAAVRANDLHPIAVFAPARLAEFPDTPTMRELGHDLNFSIWQGLFAPRGTPPATVARYEEACRSALGSAPVRAGLERIQTPILFRGARDFEARILADADADALGRMIEEGGLRRAQ